MINAVERANDIGKAEMIAKHHYMDVAWKFAKEALGTKGPYEHTTTLGELKQAREAYEELVKASLLADRNQREE